MADQLSLFDDFVVPVAAPQTSKRSAGTDAHALPISAAPTNQNTPRPHAVATTMPAAKEQVIRTVEPDTRAKLRVTLAVYRQLHNVANAVLPQLEAMLPEEERIPTILDDAAAFRIAKSALESPTLHAAIHLAACVVAPPIITETRISAAAPQTNPTASSSTRSAKNPTGRSASPVPPGKHLPFVPFVLAVADQKSPYRLPEIRRFSTVYITPERIRIRNENGQETNRTHQDLRCLPSEQAFVRAQELYSDYQLALDALAARYRAYGNYKANLAAAGGAAAQPQPLCSIVIRLENPDKQQDYATRWQVPTITRFEVKKHTDTVLEGKNNGLGDSSLYVVCQSEADAQALEHDHQAAVAAQRAWLQFIKELGTVREAASDGRYGKIGVAGPTMFDGVDDDADEDQIQEREEESEDSADPDGIDEEDDADDQEDIQ